MSNKAYLEEAYNNCKKLTESNSMKRGFKRRMRERYLTEAPIGDFSYYQNDFHHDSVLAGDMVQVVKKMIARKSSPSSIYDYILTNIDDDIKSGKVTSWGYYAKDPRNIQSKYEECVDLFKQYAEERGLKGWENKCSNLERKIAAFTKAYQKGYNTKYKESYRRKLKENYNTDIRQVLEDFALSYRTICDLWNGYDAETLEDACGNLNLDDYPFFTKSFDELGIAEWAFDMIGEIDNY